MSEKTACQNQIQRLNRARGQVEGVVRMIHEERGSREILTQLRAARSALRAVEVSILSEHLRRSLQQPAVTSEQAINRIDELIDLLTRYGL